MLTKLLSGGVFDLKYNASKAGETERFCVPWAAGGKFCECLRLKVKGCDMDMPSFGLQLAKM